MEDEKLLQYAEAIYGQGGQSVLENLMAKAAIRLRDRYPYKSDEQISYLVNKGLHEMLSKYVEQ
nr:hypothetical protein [Ectobacillus ponti]